MAGRSVRVLLYHNGYFILRVRLFAACLWYSIEQVTCYQFVQGIRYLVSCACVACFLYSQLRTNMESEKTLLTLVCVLTLFRSLILFCFIFRMSLKSLSSPTHIIM